MTNSMPARLDKPIPHKLVIPCQKSDLSLSLILIITCTQSNDNDYQYHIQKSVKYKSVEIANLADQINIL